MVYEKIDKLDLLEKWFDNLLDPSFCIEFPTNNLTIKNVIFNPPATIIFWSDGTKTKSICHEDDKFSKECGVSICVAKKMLGNKKFKEAIDIWCEDDKDIAEAKYKVGDVIISEKANKAFVIKNVEWDKIRKTFLYTMDKDRLLTETALDRNDFKCVYNKNDKTPKKKGTSKE